MPETENLEALDNPTLFARRHELTRDALLASRLPEWANGWLDDKTDEYLNDLPSLARDEDVLVALEHFVAHRPGDAGFIRHLCRRLVRRPNPAAAGTLRGLLARTTDATGHTARAFDEAVGHAALACDTEYALAALLREVDTPNETRAQVCAVFLSDPRTAFDRLGDRLVLGATGEAYQRRARLLSVLAADGIPDTAFGTKPASRSRGFVAADDRWAAALLALAPDKTLFEAKRALAHVPPAVLESLRPAKKKSAKAIPEARFLALGTLAVADFGSHGTPVFAWGDRALIATSPTEVTICRLDEGLPTIARFTLPGGRRFATASVGAHDSLFEAQGVLDAVLHPDGTAIALVAHGEALLVAFDGTIRAEAALHDTIAHRACFGAGGKTLFVATNGDDGHSVTVLDGETLAVLGKTKNLGEFPDPAWFTAHPHPTDDVGVFSVLCGQDGSWVKVIERAARGFAPRKQKLHGNSGYAQIYGYGKNVTATGLGAKLMIRAWPDMAIIKTTKLEGECRGGVVVGGEHVLLAIAEVADAPSRLGVHTVADGARVAEAPWPQGEVVVDRAHGALITQSAAGVTVWRVEVPQTASKRAKG